MAGGRSTRRATGDRASQRGRIPRPAPDRSSDPAAAGRQRRSPSRSSSWSRGWPGATVGGPGVALRRARPAAPSRSRRSRRSSASPTRSSSSTAGSCKGIVAGADYDIGPAIEHCPAPCFGYSFINQNPVLARPARPAAGDALAGDRGGGALAGRRGVRRRAVGAAAGHRVRPRRRWASRWPGCRCRSSSPGCWRCRSSATRLGITAPGGSYTPFTENPIAVGVRPAAALDHAGVPVRRRPMPG